ncbi:MAG TPA: outer membrane protein assembly factor BamD [Burkholderiaceae bacterium]|nr:outer membrane protein assembly factor BamD [Burkholderiaceae bacterium]
MDAIRSARAVLVFSLCAGAALLASCASSEKNDPTAKWDAERLYKEAHDEFQAGNWTKSREMLEKLETRYPFGRYAQQAEIEIAYTYYKEGDTAQCLATTERFLKENPNHPNADYVQYLRGLANFNEPPVIIGRLLGYKVAERDPKALRDSFDSFKELVSRYPNSRYAPDSIERMNWLVEALAQHEVGVARYYFQRSAYLAAIQRSQGVVRDYPSAPSTKEALQIMAASFKALGLEQLQDDTERVIDRSFSGPAASAESPR